MLGLEPLYLACEGRLVVVVPREHANEVLTTLKNCKYSEGAAVIGEITKEHAKSVVMTTEIGSQTMLPRPGGELLPRIC